MKSIDRLIVKLKMRSSDEQVAIMRALAEDNGYLVVAGYSITGITQVSDMDFKPGDDLSYYLGPAATCATEAQCEELRQALLEAERAVGEIGRDK